VLAEAELLALLEALEDALDAEDDDADADDDAEPVDDAAADDAEPDAPLGTKFGLKLMLLGSESSIISIVYCVPAARFDGRAMLALPEFGIEDARTCPLESVMSEPDCWSLMVTVLPVGLLHVMGELCPAVSWRPPLGTLMAFGLPLVLF